MNGPLRAAVFLSGGGRTLANLIHHRDHHGLPIEIPLVIGSRSGLRGIDIATAAGIRTLVVDRSSVINQTDDQTKRQGQLRYCQTMFDPVRREGCSHVIMAGFLKHVLIPDDFVRRVINIHPSLLPAFGGPGMYGDRVHAAAIQRGVQISGCTVHYVDNVYDNGPIILQRHCEVKPDDTPEQLAARVFELEKQALPDAIRRLAATATRSESRQ